MGRCLVILAIFALAGCYNPRYPSSTDEGGVSPPDIAKSQGSRARARRDGAAASGASAGSDED